MHTTARAMGDKVGFVEANATVCPDRCYPVVGNIVVYRDEIHFAETFARTLSDDFLKAISKTDPGM